MSESAVVLVVDDTPDTLALLHDSLVEYGYTVLVTTNGAGAIKICQDAKPDIVLLDAVMPGLNGFEVCQHLKSDINTRHIPVIFMTGLTESEHVVAGFSAGGIDYVTKPLNPIEVIARLNTHLKNARMMSHTQGALDAFGQAAIALLPRSNKIIWQTPLAKKLLSRYLPEDVATDNHQLPALSEWVEELAMTAEKNEPMVIQQAAERLVFTAADIENEEQWLILLREESETAQTEALRAIFKLTKREAEVLHWVIMGKTDKIISEILGTSPRTVNKHMEHVLEKLGVETRTSAASVAVNKLHSLSGHNTY